MHIPKTGGTTLTAALARSLRPAPSVVAAPSEALAARAAGAALVAGHYTWQAVELFDRPRILTVLRDPVEHALSLIGYWRMRAAEGIFSAETQPFADELVSRSADDVLLDPGSRFRTVLGMMTRFLGGASQYGTSAPVSPDMPAVASRNLDTCYWVGTTGTLDRDMGTLGAMLGVRLPELPRRNTNPARPRSTDLGPAARRVLDELTAGDRALYEQARAIADDRRYGGAA